MKTHTFWFAQLLAVVCIFAVGSIHTAYADAHEAGEEMAEEEASSASGWFRTDTDSLGHTDMGGCQSFSKFPRRSLIRYRHLCCWDVR